MTFGGLNTCGQCGKPIRDDDWWCSDLCESEAQRRDEEANLDAVIGPGAEAGRP